MDSATAINPAAAHRRPRATSRPSGNTSITIAITTYNHTQPTTRTATTVEGSSGSEGLSSRAGTYESLKITTAVANDNPHSSGPTAPERRQATSTPRAAVATTRQEEMAT